MVILVVWSSINPLNATSRVEKVLSVIRHDLIIKNYSTYPTCSFREIVNILFYKDHRGI